MLFDKRKKKIINWKVQSLIALEMMGHALIFPLLFLIFLTVDPFSTMGSSQTAEFHFRATKDFFILNANKWPFFVIIILFIGVTSIIFSHHIAGPSFRFLKTFKSLRSKDLTQRIKLRKWDYLQDLSMEFNSVLENLNNELKEIKACGESIAETAKGMQGLKPELEKPLRSITDNSKKLVEIVSTYKLC